jgi:hypothetical protein
VLGTAFIWCYFGLVVRLLSKLTTRLLSLLTFSLPSTMPSETTTSQLSPEEEIKEIIRALKHNNEK